MATKSCSSMAFVTCFSEKSAGLLKRMAAFFACLLAIVFFMFYIAPRLVKHPVLQPMAEFIDERDINANMYFYTEVEEFSEAGINMDNTMAFPPKVKVETAAEQPTGD